MRETLLAIAHQFSQDQLSPGTTGNLSVRDEDGRSFWITPSGIPFASLSLDDLVRVDVESTRVIDGTRAPSTEVPLHSMTYQRRTDVHAIVHAHSLYATIFSTLNRPVKAVHYQLARVGDEVPLADYATYGSKELANQATNALGNGGAVLLKNHGLMTVAATLSEAYQYALDVEWVAKLYFMALQIGEPDVLTHDEMARVRRELDHYGQSSVTP